MQFVDENEAAKCLAITDIPKADAGGKNPARLSVELLACMTERTSFPPMMGAATAAVVGEEERLDSTRP
ncbi:hypothetical protein PG988_005625 [Apiospora saccharicola]